MAMRAVEAGILLFCIVGTVALANAGLGPVLGLQADTGVESSVNTTNENLSDPGDAGVTEGGDLSPLGALGLLEQIVSLLSNAETLAANLWIPLPIARWITSAIWPIMAIAFISIVLRTRL